MRDTRQSIEFLGFEPDVTKMRGVPGATIIGVAFEAPTPQLAYRGASELVNLILAENVKLRTGRAGDTLEFFQTEVEQLEADARASARRSSPTSRPRTSRRCPTAWRWCAPSRSASRQQLIELEREEASLKNQRATVVWVFERTGRSTATATLSPEEEQLQALKSQLIQAQAIYRSTSPQVRLLQSQIAALEGLVAEQRAARARARRRGQPGRAALRARGRAGADRRAAEVHRRGEGGDRGDARRARGLDRGRCRATRW